MGRLLALFAIGVLAVSVPTIGYSAMGYPPLTSLMPADQIQFENDSGALDALYREAQSSNPFRGEMLAKEYEEQFAKVYASRPVTGWICRYRDMFVVKGETLGRDFANYVAVTCQGEQAIYTLLAKMGPSTVNMMAHMVMGKALKFNGHFYPDVRKAYDIRLNEAGTYSMIVLDMPNQ